MKQVTAVLALLLITGGVSHAQLGVYGGFTTSRLNSANTPRIQGGTFGVQYDTLRFPLINFGVDVRAVILPSNDTTTATSVTGGPRVVVHLPVVPLHPYGEVLVGGAHVKVGQGISYQNKDGFAAGVAVGADLHILPFIDWRIIDYTYNRLQAVHDSQKSLTTGIVVHFPSP